MTANVLFLSLGAGQAVVPFGYHLNGAGKCFVHFSEHCISKTAYMYIYVYIVEKKSIYDFEPRDSN